MMKKKAYIILFLIVAVITYSFFGDRYMTKVVRNEFALFDNANIEGVVEMLGTKHHTTSFKLKGIQHEFIIWENIDENLNDSKAFGDVASKGDTIIKHAKSDTLTVLHLGKAYRYTFREGP